MTGWQAFVWCCAIVVVLVFGQLIFPTVWNAVWPTPPRKPTGDGAPYLEKLCPELNCK